MCRYALLPYQIEYKSAGDDRGYLPRYVYPYGMHKQEVLRIFFKPHFVHHPCAHGKCRYSGRADHGVYLLVFRQKNVDNLGEYNSAGSVENKGKKPEKDYEQGFLLEKLLGLHFCGNGYSEEEGDEICKHLLGGIGKRIKHTAFSDQVSEH